MIPSLLELENRDFRYVYEETLTRDNDGNLIDIEEIHSETIPEWNLMGFLGL